MAAEREGAEPSVIVDPEIYRGRPSATGTSPPATIPEPIAEPIAERDES